MALQPCLGIRAGRRDFAAAPVNLFHGLRNELRGDSLPAHLRQDDRVIDVENAGRGLAEIGICQEFAALVRQINVFVAYVKFHERHLLMSKILVAFIIIKQRVRCKRDFAIFVALFGFVADGIVPRFMRALLFAQELPQAR